MAKQEFLYVARCMSTVQGGINVELGPKTLIFGPNETKKTAIIRSVELALSRTVSDLKGRALTTKESMVFSLAPPGATILESRAILSNGQEAHYRVEYDPTTGKHGRAEHTLPPVVNPDNVFPLRALMSNVTGSAEKAQQFFMTRLAGAFNGVDILERFPAEMRDTFLGVAGDSFQIDPAHALLHVLDRAKTNKNTQKSGFSAKKDLIGQEQSKLEPEPTEQQLQHAKTELDRAREILRNSERAESAGAERKKQDDLQNQRAMLYSQKQVIAQQIAENEVVAQNVPPNAKILRDFFEWFATQVDAARGLGQDPTLAVGPTLSKLIPDVDKIRNSANNISATILAQEVAAQAVAKLREDYDRLLANIAHVEGQLAAYGESAGPQQEDLPVLALEQARMNEQHAEQTYTHLWNLKSAWEQLRSMETATTEAVVQSTNWAALEEACRKCIDTLLISVAQDYAGRVSTFLPESDRFFLSLGERDRLELSFGLDDHDVMSGAQTARVLGAMAQAATGDDGFLHVLALDERGAFDPAKLQEVIRAFREMPMQVILTSPIRPKGSIPKSWTVIDTSTGSHLLRPIGAQTPAQPAAPPNGGA